MSCVPEAACWSEWALPLSSLMTSPILFSSVCILLLLLCSVPETSAGVHPDPHPPLACAVRRWRAETAAFAWAASAVLQVTSETEGGGVSVTECLPLYKHYDTPGHSLPPVCCIKQASIHYLLQLFHVWQLPQKQHLAVPLALWARLWASGVTEWVSDWVDSPACPPC